MSHDNILFQQAVKDNIRRAIKDILRKCESMQPQELSNTSVMRLAVAECEITQSYSFKHTHSHMCTHSSNRMTLLVEIMMNLLSSTDVK